MTDGGRSDERNPLKTPMRDLRRFVDLPPMHVFGRIIDLRGTCTDHMDLCGDCFVSFVAYWRPVSLYLSSHFFVFVYFLLCVERVANYLDTTFYNLTCVSPSDWKTYGEMRNLAMVRLLSFVVVFVSHS